MRSRTAAMSERGNSGVSPEARDSSSTTVSSGLRRGSNGEEKRAREGGRAGGHRERGNSSVSVCAVCSDTSRP